MPDHLEGSILAHIHRAGLGQRARLIRAERIGIRELLVQSGVPAELVATLPDEPNTSYLLMDVSGMVESARDIIERIDSFQAIPYTSTRPSSILIARQYSSPGFSGDEAGQAEAG